MGSRPDRAFRIADRRHPLLDGVGAFLYGARWNSPGKRIIYAAASFAGALLEMLVHTRIGAVPRTHAWIEIGIPSDVSVEEVNARALPGWHLLESPSAREFGDAWSRDARSLILVVPSVVVGSGIGRNILINQDHPEFGRLKASTPEPVVWDHRLFTRAR